MPLRVMAEFGMSMLSRSEAVILSLERWMNIWLGVGMCVLKILVAMEARAG